MSVRAVVIGAGTEELVAAHYLARAGHRVTVLREGSASEDRRPASGWVPPEIVRDLALDKRGWAIARCDPWLVAPLAGGGKLELTGDIAHTARAIAVLSPRDAAQWAFFCRRMQALARLLEALYAEPPPDPLASELGGFAQLARHALRVRGLGRQGIEDLLRTLPMSIADLLDEWFESVALKGALGAAGVRHLCQGPRSGGTALNFLHQHVGSAAGVFRAPSSNIHEVLREHAPFEMRDCEAARIDVRQGRVANVVLADGETLSASLVLSGAHPRRTLLELTDPGRLDPQLVRAVQRIRSRGVVAQLTLVLDRPFGMGPFVISPSLDYLERAYDDAKYRRISSEPYLEVLDAGIASDGRHEAHVHVQFAPHALAGGTWDTAQCDRLARVVVSKLGAYVPELERSVVERRVLTPEDLVHLRRYPEGQACHAELSLDQWLWMRPVPELARYRTPIHGLYLCGQAMHPGAGTAGAAGAHAARAALRDLKKRRED